MNKKLIITLVSGVSGLILLMVVVSVFDLFASNKVTIDQEEQVTVFDPIPPSAEYLERKRIWDVIQHIEPLASQEDFKWEWVEVYDVPYDLNDENEAEDMEVIEFYLPSSISTDLEEYMLHLVLRNKLTNTVLGRYSQKDFRYEGSAERLRSTKIDFIEEYALASNVRMAFYFSYLVHVGSNNSEGIVSDERLVFVVNDSGLQSLGYIFLTSIEHRSYGRPCENLASRKERDKEVNTFEKNGDKPYNDIVFRETLITDETSPKAISPQVQNKYDLKELSDYNIHELMDRDGLFSSCEETERVEEIVSVFQYDEQLKKYRSQPNTDIKPDLQPEYITTLNNLLKVENIKNSWVYNAFPEKEIAIFGSKAKLLFRIENSSNRSKKGYFIVINQYTEELLQYNIIPDYLTVDSKFNIERVVFNDSSSWKMPNGKPVYEFRIFNTANGVVEVLLNLVYLAEDGAAIPLLRNYPLGGIRKEEDGTNTYVYDVKLDKVYENEEGSLFADYTYNQAELYNQYDVIDKENYKNIEINKRQTISILNPLIH